MHNGHWKINRVIRNQRIFNIFLKYLNIPENNSKSAEANVNATVSVSNISIWAFLI